MICNGVLSIEQMRNYISPTQLLIKSIPRQVFEQFYHIHIDTNKFYIDDPNILLNSFAEQRKSYTLIILSNFSRYFTGHSGQPNQSKVAKILLRDLVKGNLLICSLPKGYEGKKVNISNDFV